MTKQEYEVKDALKLLGNILLGGVLALAICCIVLFLASAAISVGWLRVEAVLQINVAGCAIGAACGTLFAILRCKSRTLLLGLAVAGVLFLLLLTIGVLAYDTMSLEQGSVALLCGSLCGGAAVGLLGGRPKKKKRRA